MYHPQRPNRNSGKRGTVISKFKFDGARRYRYYHHGKSEFHDQNHFLIVYSQFGEFGTSDYVWLFEDVQGNETDKTLTEDVESEFYVNLYEKLNDLQRPEHAIAEEFTEITETVHTPSFLQKWIWMILGIPMLVFLIGSAYFTLELYNWKYRNGELAPEIELDLETEKEE